MTTTTQPRPFDNTQFIYENDSAMQRAKSIQIYRRYKALWQGLMDRAEQRVQAASVIEGVAVLPDTMVLHLAHNWHLCTHGEDCLTSQALLRQRRMSTWLWLREKHESHCADHAGHIADGEDGRYLWCAGCQRGPSPCVPTSGFMEQNVQVGFMDGRRRITGR